MPAAITEKHAKFLAVLLGAILLAYTAVRASVSSMNYDESITYLYAVKASVTEIWNYEWISANNHLLNSLLIKGLTTMLPAGQFVVRLPNLLAHLLFMIFSWAILYDLRNGWLRIAGFMILNLNPFVLDFFSLARGYGLSVGLLMPSLYYAKRFTDNKGSFSRNVIFCLLCTLLAILANFALLNYYCAILACLFVTGILSSRPKRRKALLTVFIGLSLIALLISVLPQAMKLKQHREFYFGGDESFWKDTVGSLIEGTLYSDYSPLAVKVLGVFIIVLLAGAAVLFTVRGFRSGSWGWLSRDYLFLLLLILSVCTLSTVVQFHMMDTKFLIQRTALFFIPIFLLFAISLASRFGARARIAALVVLTGASVYNFGRNVNFTYSHTWKEDTKQMLADIRDLSAHSHEGKQVSLYAEWISAPTIRFYQETEDYSWLHLIENIDSIARADYVFVHSYFDPEILSSMPGAFTVSDYKKSQMILVRQSVINK